jgi:hypothetical protein
MAGLYRRFDKHGGAALCRHLGEHSATSDAAQNNVCVVQQSHMSKSSALLLNNRWLLHAPQNTPSFRSARHRDRRLVASEAGRRPAMLALSSKRREPIRGVRSE